MRPQIAIYTTGGTIDKVYFDDLSSFQVGEPQIGEVLARSAVAFDYQIHKLLQKDSLELSDEDRERIRQAIAEAPARHIVVTHGTDTMTETARSCRDIPEKTIVFTGAMQPARFHSSDAIFNIGCAVAAVQILPPGVYIAMNGRIFSAQRARKNREANQFEEE